MDWISQDALEEGCKTTEENGDTIGMESSHSKKLFKYSTESHCLEL